MAQLLPANVVRLLRELQSEEAFRRKAAAQDLGKLKVNDERVINALKVVVASDSNQYVREAAAEALRILGYELSSLEEGLLITVRSLPANVEKLLLELQSQEAFSRKLAAEKLGKLKINNERIIDALKVAAISDNNKYVKEAAAEALHTLGYELSLPANENTITCPKCGTSNPADAVNCKQCRINLERALDEAKRVKQEAMRTGTLMKPQDPKEEFVKAIADFTRAIELNPADTSAYCNRGLCYAEHGDFAQAIADFTQAIELNPSDASAYCNRGWCYAEQGDFAKAISDILRCNQDGNPDHWGEWVPEDKKYDFWCQLAHQHFVNELLSKVRLINEMVLHYWPATFFWGESEYQQYYSDKQRLYKHRSQRAARGYICITSSSTYIILRGELTKKYSIKGPGFIHNFLSMSFADRYDELYQEKNDREIVLSHKSLLGVELSDITVVLHTPNDTWRIIPLFNGSNHQYIYAALSLASQGQLIPTKVEPSSPSRQTADKATPPSDIKGSLKMLAELKAEGLISEEEYEAKKKELLARI